MFDKIYTQFNKFEKASEYSQFLTIEFVPILSDAQDTNNAFKVKYGNLMKYLLFYCYQFYKEFDMSILETLSAMQFEIELDKKNHQANVEISYTALKYYNDKCL